MALATLAVPDGDPSGDGVDGSAVPAAYGPDGAVSPAVSTTEPTEPTEPTAR
jgi:hypothetical protein